MMKPEYFHTGSLAVAVLASNNTLVRETPNGDVHAEVEHYEPAEHASGDWLTFVKSVSIRNVRLEQWFAECALWGHEALQNSVEIDPNRRGGVPVLKGTRFTVAQTLAELADSSGVPEIANEFDLDEETIRQLLYGLALLAEKPRP
jgi:uncharacterized protein (DUF433 family)